MDLPRANALANCLNLRHAGGGRDQLWWPGPTMVALERCSHFRRWHVQELGPEDVSLLDLERCPHFRRWHEKSHT